MTTESDRTAEQTAEPAPAAPVTEASVDATPAPSTAEELPDSAPAPYADTTDPGRPAD